MGKIQPRIGVKYFFYIQAAYLLLSFSALMSKIASRHAFFSKGFLTYYLLSLVILILFAIIWQQILKRVDVISAYSQRCVILIWVLLWSYFFFEEAIKINNIIGALIIVFGIILISKK